MATYIPSGLLVSTMREVADNVAAQAQGTSLPWAIQIDPAVIQWLIANLPPNTIMTNYLLAQLQGQHAQVVQAVDGQATITMGEVITV